jgi:hypothetical protein
MSTAKFWRNGLIAMGVAIVAALLIVALHAGSATQAQWVYCKHVPDTWQAVQTVPDVGGQTPAQACAGLDAYNGDTWVPTTTN